jgi:hypothetical protein
MALMFRPDSYPATPVQVKIFAGNSSGKDQPFILYAYPDKDGKPDESRLLFKMDDQVIPQSKGEWETYDLPSI